MESAQKMFEQKKLTTKEDKVDLLEAVLQLVNNLYRIS